MSYVLVFVPLVIVFFVAVMSGSCYFHDVALPIPMYAHQGIFSAAKNAVYLFGGLTGTTWNNRIRLNKVYKWDLNDPSSWFVEIGTTPNTAGSGWFSSWSKNAVLVNGQVFFIGIDHDDWQSGKMFVYDLNSESFISEPKTPMPHPSLYGCLTTNMAHIFMVDGDDDSRSSRLPIIQVYDIAADAWTSQVLQAGPLITSEGWNGQYCSLVGDALYVLGGFLGSYIDDIYRINTLTLEIEQLDATLPSPEALGVSIYDGDRNLYLFGANSFEIGIVAVDLDTLSVSTAFQSQQSYSSAPVLTINGSIYRFGGKRTEGDSNYFALNQVEICDLPTDIPTQSPTKLPTSIPTATRSSLPTTAPSKIPTQTPANRDSNEFTNLVPQPTQSPTKTPTKNPTNPPTRPSPPSNNEYGVDTTIKLDSVLPTNETDELVTALDEYAQSTANATNCSERINVSPQEIEEDKTVIKVSIVTCSEATEKQLLVFFNETVLEYDIIGRIVNEAEVEEIEIEGIYASRIKSDDDSPSTPNHDWLTIVVIVLVVLISGAMIRKCYVERKISKMLDIEDRIERENDDVANHDDPIVEPGALIADNIGPAMRDTLPDVHAEIFETIHLFNARHAPMMVMPAVINATDDGEDDDDQDNDDLFGAYKRGTTNAAGVENVKDGKLLVNDEPITVEGDHDVVMLPK